MSEEDFRNVGLANWTQHQAKQVEDIAEKSVLVARLRAENERLRALLDRIAEELSQAGIDDCEGGVKWLNERAAENYLKEYRHTKTAIEAVVDLARAALKENSDEH